MKVRITKDTLLKALPAQSEQIKARNIPDGLIIVNAGNVLPVCGYEPIEGAPDSDSDNHIYIQLEKPPKGLKELRWFIYGGHCCIEGTEPGNNPQDKPAKRVAGPTIQVPGIKAKVPVTQPIYLGSHFNWSEFTKGGSRIPVNATVTQRIVKVAHYMDSIRSYLGDRTIHITSGYRDPYSNRRVGGARDSRHMYGDAVDFWVEGMNVVDVFYKLKKFHEGGGLAVGNGFVHIDLRPGAAARWTYPGGPQVALW